MQSRLTRSGIAGRALEVGIATALASISWAWEEFGDRSCVLASMQDAVLIDLALRVDARIPVVFLDTGYHFAETHETVRRVESRYGIEIEVVGPLGPVRADVRPGECCDSKVELLRRALADRDAWMSGIRRSDTAHRVGTALIDLDRRRKVKVSPLAQWDDADRSRYIERYDVITHPLLAEGYTSIGCEPCTSLPDERGGRSGRWAGSDRTECGLHV